MAWREIAASNGNKAAYENGSSSWQRNGSVMAAWHGGENNEKAKARKRHQHEQRL